VCNSRPLSPRPLSPRLAPQRRQQQQRRAAHRYTQSQVQCTTGTLTLTSHTCVFYFILPGAHKVFIFYPLPSSIARRGACLVLARSLTLGPAEEKNSIWQPWALRFFSSHSQSGRTLDLKPERLARALSPLAPQHPRAQRATSFWPTAHTARINSNGSDCKLCVEQGNLHVGAEGS
jgi:hypothetical protein